MDPTSGPKMSSLARVEVLNTGTELLFGSVINTHLSFLGQQLFPLGLRVQRQVTVPDGDAIRDAILESANRCDMILLTGGLGPTSDDITREIVAELTRRPLRYDDRIFQKIRERFERRGLKLTDRISRQAYVPEGAAVLTNDFGTAPGLYLPARTGIPHLFLFPGPRASSSRCSIPTRCRSCKTWLVTTIFMPGSFGQPVWANHTSRKRLVINSWLYQVWS